MISISATEIMYVSTEITEPCVCFQNHIVSDPNLLTTFLCKDH